MKLPAINYKMVLNAAFSAARSLVNPLFVALLSYVFIHQHLPDQLQQVNKITALINLLLIFSGWGLKDYLMKESSQPYADFSKRWQQAFYSKVIVLLPLLVITLFLFSGELALLIGAILVLRTWTALYEPLIILHKKNGLFFFMELLIAIVFIVAIQCRYINDFRLFFYGAMLAEVVKLLLYAAVFRLPARFSFHYKTLLQFLKETRFYFLLVLVSFFQSRADFYLLGFLFDTTDLNQYQLLVSLISLAQIVIAAFVVSYAKLFFRDIGHSLSSFKKLVARTAALVALPSAVFIYIVLNAVYGFAFSWFSAMLVLLNILLFGRVLYEMYYYTRMNWLSRMPVFVFMAGIANCAACIILIPMFGLNGALTGSDLSLLVLAALCTWRRLSETPSPKA